MNLRRMGMAVLLVFVVLGIGAAVVVSKGPPHPTPPRDKGKTMFDLLQG